MGMNENRLTQCLSTLKERNKKALVTYIVSGDPSPEVTLPALHQLVASGADIIELGVPFSDPMAEGPTIQRGHERALEHNTSLLGTLAVVEAFRQENTETPIVLMGYANPIVRMEFEVFAKKAAAAGVDGLITVDLPPEEAVDLNAELKSVGIHNIFLIAPTTTEDRIKQITRLASGFIYYVSLKGVTGAGHLDSQAVEEKLALIKNYTALPLLVGFGIKDAESARSVGRVSDGVVVGSVLVQGMGDHHGDAVEKTLETLNTLIQPIREGLDT